MSLILVLLLQLGVQLPDPDVIVNVGGEIEGPYIFREDLGQTTKVILKNGLRVIVRENNAVPLTAVATRIEVGPVDEQDELRGASRIVRQLILTGPSAPTARIQALGGSASARTEATGTVYSMIVPPENVAEALRIQSEAIFELGFDAETFSREAAFVRDSTEAEPERLQSRIQRGLYGAAFAGHPLGTLGDGFHDTAPSAEAVADFHSRYYQPSNAILILVGAFEREAMLADIVRLYGDLTDLGEERDRPLPPETQGAMRYNWERGPVALSHVAIGYHVPGLEDAGSDAYALELLSALLSRGRASRLDWFLRDEQGLISDGDSSYVAARDWGLFFVQMEARDLTSAEVAFFSELDRIRRFGVRGEGLARAKLLAAEEHYRKIETVEGLARTLARDEANGDWKRSLSFLEGIQQVQEDDIGRVVNTYFDYANASVFEYLPMESSRAFSRADFESEVLGRVPLNIVERSIDERSVAGDVRPGSDTLVMDVMEGFERRSIRGGLNVVIDAYIAEDHRSPLVSFGIFYPGGRLYESEENAGITELMLRASLRGTRRYNTADIARRIGNAGARIEIVNEPDFFGYMLHGVSGAMPEALDVLMDVLQEPTFLEADVEREKILQESELLRRTDDVPTHATQLFMSTVFDDHSYARSGLGSRESLANLTWESLLEWHAEHERTLVPLIAIAGDTRGTALIASIADILTNDDLFFRDLTDLPLPSAPLDTEEVTYQMNGGGSVIVHGGMVGPYTHPDRLALTVLGSLLSGPGGRLSETLRRSGLAQTVEVHDAFLARAGVLYVYAAFRPGDEALVRQLVELEFDGLIQNGVTDDELDRAAAFSIGRYQVEHQTQRRRILELPHALFSGANTPDTDEYARAIRSVNRQMVQEVAERYLNANQSKIVVVRSP